MPSKGKHFAANVEEEGSESPSSSFADSHKPSRHLRYEGATTRLPRLKSTAIRTEGPADGQRSASKPLAARRVASRPSVTKRPASTSPDVQSSSPSVSDGQQSAARFKAAAEVGSDASSSPYFSKNKSAASDDAKKPPAKPKAKKRGFLHSKAFTILVALILVLSGVALIGYPYASDYLNKVEQSKVAQTQDQVVQDTPKEDLSAQLQAAVDYNARLRSGRVRVTDPFDPNAPTVSDEEYYSLLNLNGDGVMGQIIIPKIGVDLPIYHGVDGDGMEHGVGHMPQTSLPVGGDSTHAVLAGHTGLPSAKIFDNIDQLQVGDWFIIHVLGEDHAYKVTSTEVVLPDQTQSLAIEDGKDLVTLVTCTPYGINTHRLLVHAERCDVPDEWLNRNKTDSTPVTQSVRDNPILAMTLIGLAVGLGVVVGLLLVARHRRKLARAQAAAKPAGGVADRSAGEASDAATTAAANAASPYGAASDDADDAWRGAHTSTHPAAHAAHAAHAARAKQSSAGRTGGAHFKK